MSEAGKLKRGAKWYSFNKNGVLPDEIKNDKFKMCDVEFYLNSLKPKEEEIKDTKKRK